MAYKFQSSISDPEHFVSRYITYASARTSAPWDYHESLGLMLLSIATQGILWRIPAIPEGLATNLFIMNHGDTSRAMKSTAMKIAKEMQRLAMPGCDLPENFTPQALEESLGEFSNRPAVIWADEFKGHIDKMYHQSYMAGLRTFLLTMYGERCWTYRRANKGKEKSKEDVIKIDNVHLCLAGNTTPALAESLRPADIEDGFLPRFAVVWPQDYPPIKGFREMSYDQEERDALAKWLRHIRDAAIQMADIAARRSTQYDSLLAHDAVYDIFDEYQRKMNSRMSKADPQTQAMCQRLTVMGLKVSVLLAAGRPGMSSADHILVTALDAEEALKIVEKWRGWAEMFIDSLSVDIMDRDIRIVSSMLIEHNGKVSRTQVARRIRTTKRKLDELEMTMGDRGLIRLAEIKVGASNKPTMFWLSPEYYENQQAAAGGRVEVG